MSSPPEGVQDAARAEPDGNGTEPLFDPAVIAEVGIEGEEAHELLGIYVTSALENLTDMEKALARGDADAYQRAAHTLKGSSGAIGALRLHKTLVGLMGREDPASLVEGMSKAQAGFEDTRRAMDAWMAGHGSSS